MIFQGKCHILPAVLLAGVTTIVASPASGNGSSTLHWKDCPSSYGWAPGLQCAEMEVPLDWDKPCGPGITLFMNKAPAKDPKKRIGSLILNPGGPGGAATETVNTFVADEMGSPALLEHFDLIGPNPRGCPISTPIRCNPDLWNKRMTRFPKNETIYKEVVAHWTQIGQDCMERTGPSFNYSDTVNAARDLEAIRVALGGEPLTYMGFSYGTVLGSHYAELFPGNIRAMVLDANGDHSYTGTQFSIEEMRDYEIVVDHFTDWAATNETSPLKGQDVGKLLDELFTNADKTPVPAPGCKQDNSTTSPCRPDATGEEMRMAMQFKIIFPFNYPILAEYVYEALNGNATGLSWAWYTGPTHSDFSQNAIFCQDWLHSNTWTEWVNRDNLLRSVSPHLQGVTWFPYVELMCQGWPAPITTPQRPTNISGTSAPILLVNALYDPQSPYSMAVTLQRGIEGSVLLSRDGDGHSSYAEHGETQKAVDDYLINLKVPAVGTVYKT
ncbi:Alpha/Beta hydrolase protein [Xylogone sp. PMI_703]|nr:Alpha/Beta hydrolase protein [Xylogone sp. PMI_703]